MRSSRSKVQSLKIYTFRNQKYAIRNFSGFAYIALLVFIIIIGISLGAAGKYWSNVMLRDKEEELLFRGDQYRLALERYYTAIPGMQMYPQSIDELLKDPRSPVGKRHLRQKYKDPITGEDFEEIKDPFTKRILGVRSTSDKESLKQAGFPPTVLVPISAGTYSMPVPIAPKTSESESFASDKESVASDKIKYSDWLFVSTIKAVQTRPTSTRPVATTPTSTSSTFHK
jgi:type II secretory pathway pseudopilin PulG